MENNFNENMNLGNIVSNSPIENSISSNIYEGNTQQMNVDNVKTENNVEDKKVSTVLDKFMIKTELLRELVNGASKVASYEQIRVTSQVIDLQLDENGIKVTASNGNIDYECVDNTYTYTNKLRACVDIMELSKLLTYIDFETVELEYDDESNILKIKLPQGAEYLLARRTDPSTQQAIELNLTFPMKYEEMTEINFENMINAINSSKALRNISNVNTALCGVYFSDLVVATEGTLIALQQNQDILKTQNFFINNEFCKLITTATFDALNVKIGFTTDSNNDIRAITLSDGKLTICGNVSPEYPMTADKRNEFWNVKQDVKIGINTKRLLNTLNRLSIFQKQTLDDVVYVTVEDESLIFQTNNKVVTDRVMIDNPLKAHTEFMLSFTKLRKIITDVKDDIIYLTLDNSKDNFISLDLSDCKWIIAKMS